MNGKQAAINAPNPRRLWHPYGVPKPATRRKRRRILRDARRVVRARYRDPDLSLLDVADAVGTSPRQLQRVCREEGGEDFRTMLLRVRMREAVRLLTREPNQVPAVHVAPRVGYRGASGLRQAFRRLHGCPPSAVQLAPPEYLGDVTFDTTGQERGRAS